MEHNPEKFVDLLNQFIKFELNEFGELMQQKIIEIIEFLIAEINQLQEPHFPDIDLLSKKLLEKGYSESDIQAAVEWIVEFIDRSEANVTNEGGSEKQSGNLRLFSAFENKIFSTEAYGFLLQMQSLRLLTPLQLEQIIDRFVMLGMDSVGLEDVKAATAQLLVGKDIGSVNSNAVFHPGNEQIH